MIKQRSAGSEGQHELEAAVPRLEAERAILLAHIADTSWLENHRTARRPTRDLGEVALGEARECLAQEVRWLAVVVTCRGPPWGEDADDNEPEHERPGEREGADGSEWTAENDEDVAMEDMLFEPSTRTGLVEAESMDLDASGTANHGVGDKLPIHPKQEIASAPPKRKRREDEGVFEAVNAHRHKRILPEAQRRRRSFAFTIPL